MPGKPIHSAFCYSAYGLKISSEFPISELPLSDTGGHVTVKRGKVDDASESQLATAEAFTHAGVTARAAEGIFSISWKGLGTALIKRGDEVIIEMDERATGEDWGPYINGPILAAILHQRGFLVLHSSAIISNGKAMAFLGDKGAGKSTITSNLSRLGHQFLSDDLLPVQFENGVATTSPGFPLIRLWPDSVISMGVDPQTLPKINRLIDKREFKLAEMSPEHRIKLGRIYVLREGDQLEIRQLGGREAFVEVTKNSYLNRYLKATGQTANHFVQCSDLVSLTPVFRLTRPHDFTLIDSVSKEVQRHMMSPD